MGLAEQMVGIKAKAFLMNIVFDLAKKYSFLSTKWAEVTAEIIHDALNTFSPEEKRLEDHTQKFLQWMGFTPVDLSWDPERRVLNIYIGTSRIWREDPLKDQVSNIVMRSLISALGANFFNGERPNVVFVKENLPPRTQFGFRISEGIGQESFSVDQTISKEIKQEVQNISDSESIQELPNQITDVKNISAEGPSKPSISKAIKRLQLFIDPVLGSGVNKEEVYNIIYESVTEILQEHYDEEYRSVINDVGSYNLLQIVYKKSSEEGKQEKIATSIGTKIGEKLEIGELSPNNAISGIGKMDPSSIDELLFYTKEKHQDEGFCAFISNIWLSYINKFMPTKFKADQPLCKVTSSGMCLYAYNPN